MRWIYLIPLASSAGPLMMPETGDTTIKFMYNKLGVITYVVITTLVG
jgi:hypothetical protein